MFIFATLAATVVSFVGAFAMSLFDYLGKRAAAMSLAQQSRGLAHGPGLTVKVKSLLAVVIPLVAVVIVESTTRGHALSARGLGQIDPRLDHVQPPTARDKLALAIVSLLCLSTLVLI